MLVFCINNQHYAIKDQAAAVSFLEGLAHVIKVTPTGIVLPGNSTPYRVDPEGALIEIRVVPDSMLEETKTAAKTFRTFADFAATTQAQNPEVKS